MDLAAPWFTWEGTSSLAWSRGNRCHENTQEPREQFTVQAGEQGGGLGKRGRGEGQEGGHCWGSRQRAPEEAAEAEDTWGQQRERPAAIRCRRAHY